MKWKADNIIGGVIAAKQHPTIEGRFNVPLMLVRVPKPCDFNGPDPFIAISLQDGYSFNGPGKDAEAMAKWLNDGDYFPVNKLITSSGSSDLSKMVDNRLGTPYVMIMNSHA